LLSVNASSIRFVFSFFFVWFPILDDLLFSHDLPPFFCRLHFLFGVAFSFPRLELYFTSIWLIFVFFILFKYFALALSFFSLLFFYIYLHGLLWPLDDWFLLSMLWAYFCILNQTSCKKIRSLPQVWCEIWLKIVKNPYLNY
jgi:hypothetical protein